MNYTELIFRHKTNTLFAIYLNQSGTKCQFEIEQLPEIPNYDLLMSKLDYNAKSVKVKNLREWGFSELVEEMDCKFSANTLNSFKYLKDEEELDLIPEDKTNYLLYLCNSTLLNRIICYKINRVLPNLYQKNLIDYGLDLQLVEHKQTEFNSKINYYYENKERIEKELDSMTQKWSEMSYNNLNKGLFNSEIKIDNRPFLSLSMGLTSSEYKIPSPIGFENPKWELQLSGKLYFCKKNRKSIDGPKNIDELIEIIFHTDTDHEKDRICTLIESVFNRIINNDDICYDFISESYFLSEKEEESIISSILPRKAVDEIEEIARYTTFETGFEIIRNGNIRMNSLVSMNDKSETDFLPELVSNFEDETEEMYDKILLADRKFISCFTTKIDDLDMWRLYGNNARGICLVFKRTPKDDLYKISYINPSSAVVKEMNSFMDKLKDDKIRFKFILFQKYRHYMKHNDYKSEDEYRFLVESNNSNGWYINKENNILTPFASRELKKSLNDNQPNSYPFMLYKIILGPSSANSYTNIIQFYDLIKDIGYDEMIISESSIKSYR